MTSTQPHSSDAELRHTLDAVYYAQARADDSEGTGAMPSLSDSRDLLRLFIQIANDDVRHALLQLMRTIAGPAR